MFPPSICETFSCQFLDKSSNQQKHINLGLKSGNLIVQTIKFAFTVHCKTINRFKILDHLRSYDSWPKKHPLQNTIKEHTWK